MLAFASWAGSGGAQLSTPGILGVIAGTGINVTNPNGPFPTVATSGSSGVTTTGSPANGNLTKFSGAGTITNGDLSGDCTTSGALVITCTKTSGTAFTNGATTVTTSRTTTVSASSITLVDAWDSQYNITSQAAGLTITAPATCTTMNHFVVRLIDNGSPQTITYSGSFRDLQDTRPTTTTAGKFMYLGFYCNASNTLDFVALNTQP